MIRSHLKHCDEEIDLAETFTKIQHKPRKSI